jgi:hypothetical protein
MKQVRFLELETYERLQVLWEEGEVISQKKYYDTTISLFLLDNFFVEVFFDPAVNDITAISVQEHPQILYAYVCDLDLSEIEKLLQ